MSQSVFSDDEVGRSLKLIFKITIHIYKKLFEDLKSAIDQRKEKPEIPDDCD